MCNIIRIILGVLALFIGLPILLLGAICLIGSILGMFDEYNFMTFFVSIAMLCNGFLFSSIGKAVLKGELI